VKLTQWLQVALGVAALATAVWLFVAGSIWIGFWLLVVGIVLLVRQPIRRYRRRVAHADPDAPAPRFWSLLRRLNISDPARPVELHEGARVGDEGAFSGRFDGHP
jgi:hypothetical protein